MYYDILDIKYRELVAPLTGQQFVQEILMQEAGVRLIRNDLIEGARSNRLNEHDKLQVENMSNTKLYDYARTIMYTSQDYGRIMFPVTLEN